MIDKYVTDLASQMGIKLTKASLVDGTRLGCKDANLLNLSYKGDITSALIFKYDLQKLETGVSCYSMEIRIRKALLRLLNQHQIPAII
jgi:hypothetical protein